MACGTWINSGRALTLAAFAGFVVCWTVVVKTFAPGPALVPFVRAYEIIETDDAAVTRTLFPETGLLIGFRYAGSATLLDSASSLNDEALNDASQPDGGATQPLSLPSATITGLRTSTREMRTSANGGIVIAKFRAAGAVPFFDAPLHDLFGSMRPLDTLIDPLAVGCVLRQIIDVTSDADRLALIERFLLAQIRHDAPAPDPLVSAALRAICTAAGVLRVAPLARDLGVSQDTLEKRFRRIVGASPKQFASIVRIRRAVELSRDSDSLTTLALDAGYYDQSHFIRDFRAITGDAPGHFFGTARYC